jgi:hypothetical protein
MNRLKDFCKTRSREGMAVFMFAVVVFIAGCAPSAGGPPAEGADVVVKKFYEHISNARIMGGTTPLREAYKLISSSKSRLSQARFMEIARKYPPAFNAEVVKTETKGKQAFVTITYKMPSMFGEYTVNTEIPLSVDETTNTWKIDFTGELDGQDQVALSKGKQ